MTTENIVQDTEESRIAQQKRETLHSLLYIMAENAPSAEKFMGIDVKALARKVSEAYDQLGLEVTTDSGSVSPLTALLDTLPGNNVMTMRPGSDASKTAAAGTAAQGDYSLKASKKEYAKYPSYVTSISFGEIHDVNGQLRMEALICWSDGSHAEKSVWCGDLGTPKSSAEIAGRERIWLYTTTKDEQCLMLDTDQ